MFNLETSITEWRRQMLAAGIKTPVPLDELENHLREEIERQMRSGADDERAFEAAAQKIGSASALKSEFKKVDAARKERTLGMEKNLVFVAANLTALTICGSLLSKPRGLTFGQQMSCLAAITTFTLLLWAGRLGYRLFPVISAKRTRILIAGLAFASVALWWVVFFYFILARYDLTPDQFTVVFIWGFITPAGVAWALGFGIDTAARKKGALAVS